MPMNHRLKPLMFFTFLLALAAGTAHAQSLRETDLVSNVGGVATLTDPNLIGPWGITHNSATSPFWVANMGSSTATLYSIDASGTVAKVPLTVSFPFTAAGGQGPSGILLLDQTNFLLQPQGTAANLIFAEINGDLGGWNGGLGTTAESEVTSPGAAYTGVTVATASAGTFVYAVDNQNGRIDVFDSNFHKVNLSGNFIDPNLPTGSKPLNVALIGGQLFVSYGVLGAASAETSLVDVFDLDGVFMKRFATGGSLKNPWAMVQAPDNFGKFSDAILIGNFVFAGEATPGNISAFNASTGASLGLLQGSNGSALDIEGLRGLIFGNGGAGGDTHTLYFTAAIHGGIDGLFGSLSACHGVTLSNESANPNPLPPTDKGVLVTISYTATDDCDPAPACTLGGITVSEPGKSTRTPEGEDAIIEGPKLVDLRARKRDNGLVYNVGINCHDAQGSTASASVSVTVLPEGGNDGGKGPQ